MKKLFAFCAGLLAVLNQTAVTALAAEPEAAGAAAQTPLWLCIPFAGLLLCIAVLPLVKAEWWEAHQPHAVVFWSLLFLIPFAVKYGVPKAAETTLEMIYGKLAEDHPEIEAVDISVISQDKDAVYLSVFCMKDQAADVENTLRTACLLYTSDAADE